MSDSSEDRTVLGQFAGGVSGANVGEQSQAGVTNLDDKASAEFKVWMHRQAQGPQPLVSLGSSGTWLGSIVIILLFASLGIFVVPVAVLTQWHSLPAAILASIATLGFGIFLLVRVVKRDRPRSSIGSRA